MKKIFLEKLAFVQYFQTVFDEIFKEYLNVHFKSLKTQKLTISSVIRFEFETKNKNHQRLYGLLKNGILFIIFKQAQDLF